MAEVYSIQVLHHFETNLPVRLIRASDGNFYGTTHAKTPDSVGSVFKATPSGAVTTLFSFSGAIGNDPGGLIEGRDGNFYGVTTFGHGANGSVFRLTPAGVFDELHVFSGPDGVRPFGPLLHAADGYLYGTTTSGGANGIGTVYRLKPSTGAFSSLFSFAWGDGAQPLGGLVELSDGTIYGSTSLEGSGSGGTIFRLNADRTLTTLFSLTRDTGYGFVQFVLAKDGNLYGTAAQGGEAGYGTVFRLTPAGEWTTLSSFAGTNGDRPRALSQGSDGNFYGVTQEGGAHWKGTIFRLTPAGELTMLAEFDLANGAQPTGQLAEGTDGRLYGVAYRGGKFGSGTFFRVVKTPRVTVRRTDDGGLELAWDSFGGGTYRLESKSSLSEQGWSLHSELTAAGTSDSLAVPISVVGQGYFRVVLLP